MRDPTSRRPPISPSSRQPAAFGWLLLPAAQAGTPSPTAVRDTIAAVFAQRVYDRAIIRTVWDRILDVVREWFRALFDAIGSSPAARHTILIVIAVVSALVVGRVIVAGVLGERVLRRGETGRTTGGAAGDPWVAAQRLAAQGHYTDAAHALYRALLESIAGREQLRLHPSKTVGDYARDLRRRSSGLFTPFRDFARSYEIVVYGLGVCDRVRYERLYALAAGMVTPPK